MATGTLLVLLTKLDTFAEKQGEFKHEAQKYLESYKERINKRLASYGMSKTRIKFQVFEKDSKTDVENKKRKYSHYYHINTLL
jgi:hypothetical protein